MEDSITHTRRALLLTLGGGTAMSLLSNPAGADRDEDENTYLEMHQNIDAEESENEETQQYPTPECKVIRPTDYGRRKAPKQ